jgi:hypothetical protein
MDELVKIYVVHGGEYNRCCHLGCCCVAYALYCSDPEDGHSASLRNFGKQTTRCDALERSALLNNTPIASVQEQRLCFLLSRLNIWSKQTRPPPPALSGPRVRIWFVSSWILPRSGLGQAGGGRDGSNCSATKHQSVYELPCLLLLQNSVLYRHIRNMDSLAVFVRLFEATSL